MILPMLTDTASWERKIGSDSWEGDTYASAVSIPAFKAERSREVVGPGGLEIHQIGQIAVTEDVQVGDKIDGNVVQGRTSIKGLDTGVLGYVLSTD